MTRIPAMAAIVRRQPKHSGRLDQQGLVLLYTLVALVVLLVTGVAVVRALDSSLLQAGNMAYQRDLIHQAQRAMVKAQAALSTGALALESDRNTHKASANYYATRLASNAQGVPSILLDDTAFAAAGLTAGDIVDTDTNTKTNTGVTLRYVIDRQCSKTGDYSDNNSCALNLDTTETSADALYKKINGVGRPVYRISVRATGPRNTLAFFQATVTK